MKPKTWIDPDSKDPRIDIDLTSIRHFRVGLISNRCWFEGLCYPGSPAGIWRDKNVIITSKQRHNIVLT